jgi:RNA polymerase sigma-70 factor, ECF subfamily
LFAIADHKVKDFLRSYYRKKSLIELDFAEVEKFFSSEVTNDPTSGEVLSELLGDLSERQRQIIYSMKIEGYTAKEVAGRMSMSESAVKVAAHRADKILIKRNREKND